MRAVNVAEITAAIAELSMDANYNLGDDVYNAFKDALDKETSPVGKSVLEQLITNAEIAKEEQVPMCQDTG